MTILCVLLYEHTKEPLFRPLLLWRVIYIKYNKIKNLHIVKLFLLIHFLKFSIFKHLSLSRYEQN